MEAAFLSRTGKLLPESTTSRRCGHCPSDDARKSEGETDAGPN